MFLIQIKMKFINTVAAWLKRDIERTAVSTIETFHGESRSLKYGLEYFKTQHSERGLCGWALGNFATNQCFSLKEVYPPKKCLFSKCQNILLSERTVSFVCKRSSSDLLSVFSLALKSKQKRHILKIAIWTSVTCASLKLSKWMNCQTSHRGGN